MCFYNLRRAAPTNIPRTIKNRRPPLLLAQLNAWYNQSPVIYLVCNSQCSLVCFAISVRSSTSLSFHSSLNLQMPECSTGFFSSEWLSRFYCIIILLTYALKVNLVQSCTLHCHIHPPAIANRRLVISMNA